METDKSKVVSVMSFNSVMEAQLYQALLESAGVRAHLQNDIATQVYPPIGMLLPVNILVAEEDQEKAREILGAKFDIDEFKRQANSSDAKPASRKPAVKKSAPKAGPRKKTTGDKPEKPVKAATKKPATAKN